MNPATDRPNLCILPIEEIILPEEDVSDLKDVFDAINKLCDTMKTSLDEQTFEDCSQNDNISEFTDTNSVSDLLQSHYESTEIISNNDLNETIETHVEPIDIVECHDELTNIIPRKPRITEIENPQYIECIEVMTSSEEILVQKVETFNSERWSDTTSQRSFPQVDDVDAVTSDTEPALAQGEPVSEMYYTASSEVSLLSEADIADKIVNVQDGDKDDRKECVIAGHVAAMREKFESMTRTNTPLPELMRSVSPSLDVFTNVTPSPDRLG